MRKVRKLRHWKQRFEKGAEFIWRKPVTWAGEQVEVGDPIPQTLKDMPAKLRRFWEAHVIELAKFEEPDVVSGQVDAAPAKTEEPPKTEERKPEDLVSKETDRKWRVEGLEEVFKSKTLATEAAAALLDKAPSDDDADDQTLLGSDAQPSEFEVFGETVALGEVVQLAFEHSELTMAEWNELEDDDRELRISEAVNWMFDEGEEDDDFLGG